MATLLRIMQRAAVRNRHDSSYQIGSQLVLLLSRSLSTHGTESLPSAASATTTAAGADNGPGTGGAGSAGHGPADDDDEYWRSAGTVEGVWMFSRHGDRSPGRPLSPAHRQGDEAAFWMTTLPTPDTAAAFEAFLTRYPLHIHPGFNQGKFIDTARNPFGFLTLKGILELREKGREFFHRYNQLGYHLPRRSQWRRGVAEDFLDAWDVQVYSTNYLRTILSVQSFLDGLLGTHCYQPDPLFSRPYDPSVRKELRVPHHAWQSPQPQSHQTPPPDPLVKIQIRDMSNDPLNAFDRNPELIADLVSDVMLKDDFLQRDGAAAPLAARLANILPGLVRERRTSSDFGNRAPSGINWVEAADHFICRASHGVALSRFSDFEHDDRVEYTLMALSSSTLDHLAWRFRMWYQNKRLLAVIAAPILREVMDQLQKVLLPKGSDNNNNNNNQSHRARHPFTIYSCHDITILGLLYGIRADFLADDQSSRWRWWPKYGCNLTFELVRLPPPAPSPPNQPQPPNLHTIATTSAGQQQQQHDVYVMRVLLNGELVRCGEVVHHPTKNGSGRVVVCRGHGPGGMMRVDEFISTVTQLEEEGGHDYGSLLGHR